MQTASFPHTDRTVSRLGFGCMRFPTLEKDGKKVIDRPQAIAMLRRAIDSGVTYVDTAYPYHDGESETVVGLALQDGYRDRVTLTTKLPLWLLETKADMQRFLDEQLTKLKTDHVDFYLLHAASRNSWENVALKFGLLSKMEKAKADGKIRHIGFSFHDDYDAFQEIVDAYDWDFCQIQLNYIDVEHQAGLRGLEYAAAKGMGVIIMEPLLGGKLANPTDQVRKVLPADKTPVQAALDFLWNRPEVSLILSGMGTAQQLEDNLAYADDSRPGKLSEEELAAYTEAKRVYDTMARVPCTKCAYCMPCPFGVNIPGVFEAYNKSALSMEEAKALYDGLDGQAALCRKCHKCEKICPQHIAIPEWLKKVDRLLR